MKHVEKFIRHLQSSIEKRKTDIVAATVTLHKAKSLATYYYNLEDDYLYHVQTRSIMPHMSQTLKDLHKQQKTETEMLEWLENIRSSYEEMSCAIYGE